MSDLHTRKKRSRRRYNGWLTKLRELYAYTVRFKTTRRYKRPKDPYIEQYDKYDERTMD